MYSISELSAEERKYLFNRQSFSDYAADAESFERMDAASMLRIAEQRAGATDPEEVIRTPHYNTPKYHWMLSGGSCSKMKLDGLFILSSHEFGKLMEEDVKKVCRYCVSSFTQR